MAKKIWYKIIIVDYKGKTEIAKVKSKGLAEFTLKHYKELYKTKKDLYDLYIED